MDYNDYFIESAIYYLKFSEMTLITFYIIGQTLSNRLYLDYIL